MPNDNFTMRVGAIAGAVAVILLVVMIFVGLQIGPDLINLEGSLSPTLVAELFVNNQGKLRGMMAVDDVFTLAYVVAFIGLATYARRRAPLIAAVGLGFALATGALDWLENSITLGLIAYTLPNFRLNTTPLLSSDQLLTLNIVTQMKFSCANVAVALFGIGIWNERWLNRIAAILFWLFVPINALAFISAPMASARMLGMLVLLIVGTVVLWRNATRVDQLA
jgi:hypothetical protein